MEDQTGMIKKIRRYRYCIYFYTNLCLCRKFQDKYENMIGNCAPLKNSCQKIGVENRICIKNFKKIWDPNTEKSLGSERCSYKLICQTC
jgi:hypothetical protein